MNAVDRGRGSSEDSDDSAETSVAFEFFRRMVAARRCPIAGPCGRAPCPQCDRHEPHPCEVGKFLRRGTSPTEAVALALDAMTYRGGARASEPRRDALDALLGRVCREHRAVVLEELPRVQPEHLPHEPSDETTGPAS